MYVIQNMFSWSLEVKNEHDTKYTRWKTSMQSYGSRSTKCEQFEM